MNRIVNYEAINNILSQNSMYTIYTYRINICISYFQTNKLLLHSITRKCLSVYPSSDQVILTPCDSNNANQQWIFKQIVPSWTS